MRSRMMMSGPLTCECYLTPRTPSINPEVVNLRKRKLVQLAPDLPLQISGNATTRNKRLPETKATLLDQTTSNPQARLTATLERDRDRKRIRQFFNPLLLLLLTYCLPPTFLEPASAQTTEETENAGDSEQQIKVDKRPDAEW